MNTIHTKSCQYCGSEDQYCETALQRSLCKYGVGAKSIGKQADDITAILDERGNRYGSFADNARISQTLYDIILREHEARISRGHLPLQYHHKEALKQICCKICRILSGDPDYADNWDDIAGYAQLGKNPR